MRNMMRQKLPVTLKVLCSMKTGIFLSLYKGKKSLRTLFDISRKALPSSNPPSTNLYISCVINRSWLTQEFQTRKFQT